MFPIRGITLRLPFGSPLSKASPPGSTLSSAPSGASGSREGPAPNECSSVGASLPSQKFGQGITVAKSTPPSANDPPPRLTQLPSLSGDPFDASDDFPDAQAGPLSPWSVCTPSLAKIVLDEVALSTPPLTPSPSSSFTTDLSATALRSGASSSSHTASCTRFSIPTTVATAALARAFEQIRPSKPHACVPTRTLRPSLQTLLYVLAYVRPRDLDSMNEIVRILNDALAVHLGSPSLSTQCCELLSIILSIRPEFVHTVSLDLALTRARDVIATHFSTEARTVDAALKLVGTIVLALEVPVLSTRLRPAHSALSKVLTAALKNAHLLHWIVASLRQWRAVASVQTHALRAVAASVSVSKEIGLNFVMSHAIFHELVVSFAELGDDPRLIAHVCETLCVFLRRSAEFRRLSVVDRVPHALLKYTKAHVVCPRVAAAATSALAIYADDPEVLPVIVNIHAVPFAIDTLCMLQAPSPSPRRNLQRSVANSSTPRRQRAPGVQEHCNSGRKFEEPFAVAVSTTRAMVNLLDLLTSFVEKSPASLSSLTSRRCVNASAGAVATCESNLSVVRAGLQLICALCGAEHTCLKHARRSRSITSAMLGTKVEPTIPSHIPEMVIPIACTALHNHLKCADVVRLACLLLLNVCHRGFRRSVLRKSPDLLVIVEQSLQLLHDRDDVVIPAGALRMVLL